jgi:DNA polymerase III delta prime subunit
MIKRPRIVVPPLVVTPDKHWVGTKGAHDVMTTPFMQALATAGETIRGNGVCAFEGEPGLSKTFTALTAAEQLGIPGAYLEAGNAHSIRRVYEMFLRTLEWPHDPTWLAGDFEDAFLAATSAFKRLLVIDEIHRYGHAAIEIVRYAITNPKNKTSFIIVGHKLEPLLAAEPALASRARREKFRPLSRDECLEALREYDDVFKGASEAVLDPIALFSDGRFRGMAQVLAELRLLMADGRRALTATIVKEAIEATRRKPLGDPE